MEMTRRLVDEINHTYGSGYTLRSRCAGGLQGGAWLLSDESGRRAVLKWSRRGASARIEHVSRLVSRVRSSGYPTPAWPAVGVTGDGISYHVQDFVPGRPASPLTGKSTALIIEVLERHAGLDPDPARDWSEYVGARARDDTAEGPRGPLRELGSAGAAFVRRYDDLLDACGDIRLPGADLVHGDFNTGNILLHNAEVSGVIDIEALGSGSRVIDYAWLLREAYVREYGSAVTLPLRRAAESVAGPAALVLAVTATALDIVGFQVRHGFDDVPHVMERLLAMAGELAEPL